MFLVAKVGKKERKQKKQLLVGLVVKNIGVKSMPIFAESKTLFVATVILLN